MLEDSEFVCQQHSVAQVEDDIEEGFSDQSESPLILRYHSHLQLMDRKKMLTIDVQTVLF